MNNFTKLKCMICFIFIMIFLLSNLAFGSVSYIFDNFNQEWAPNNFFADKGAFNMSMGYDDSVYHGDKGFSLRLVYNVYASEAQAAFFEHFTYYTETNSVYDMSEYDEFSFYVKGEGGTISNYTKFWIRFTFIDNSGIWHSSYVEIEGVGSGWEKKSIDLKAIIGIDWTRMKELNIVFENNHGNSGRISYPLSGKLYFDDMAFVDTDVTIETDKDFLYLWQKRIFKYFWDCYNPDNGLIRDRATDRNLCSIASVGFGLTAMCIGAERGWVRQEVYERILTTLNSFYDDPDDPNDFCVEGKDGLFYHFVDINTGEWNGWDGVSTIDTAILMAGVLTCRNHRYFKGTEIETLATKIYEAAKWDSFKRDDDSIWLLWTPDEGYCINGWYGYSEGLLLYLMAIGSPTHPIPASSWDTWASGSIHDTGYSNDWGAYYGHGFLTCPCLFTHQYAHCWIDFRDKKDAYTNYFNNSISASLANRAYCLDVWYPDENIWGMSATGPANNYLPYGYPPANDVNDGTINPPITGASIVFTPEESISSIRYMYDNYKDEMWGIYGLNTAINTHVEPNWFLNDYIGIDLGAALIMIENLRYGSVWEAFMQNTEITDAMEAVGFVDDYSKEYAYYREAEDYDSATQGGSVWKEGNWIAWGRHILHVGSWFGPNDEAIYNINLERGGNDAKFTIRYSDDVAGNVIEVYLDDVKKGEFTTEDTGAWNDFAWDSEIINLGQVSAGAHTIKLKVATCASFGVNLDVFKITGVGSGALSCSGSYSDTNIEGASRVTISPDGKNAYVLDGWKSGANDPYPQTIAWFTRNTTTGELTYGSRYSNVNIKGARSVTVSPDGKHVYVTACNPSHAVAWFTRNTTTGALTYGGRYQNYNIFDPMNVYNPKDVEVSPDGKHVYVAVYSSDAVAWFTRNTTTGALTWTGRYKSTANIEAACSVTVSPDGKNVYLSAFQSDAVAWFTRNTTTGALSYVDRYSSTNINYAWDVQISPDGKSVYVAALCGHGVALFTRNTTTGDLIYVEKYSNMTIDRPYSIGISPDNKNVYVVNCENDALTWFKRNTTTGALIYDGSYFSKTINGARNITVSPDGNNVYVAAASADAVVWFTRNK